MIYEPEEEDEVSVAIPGWLNFEEDPPLPLVEVEIEPPDEERGTLPKKRRRKAQHPAAVPRNIHSIAHDEIANGNLVLLHIDLETGGEDVGVVQISCVAQKVQDTESLGEFDEYYYVKPP